jgi:hypothetical protein
MFVHCLQLRDAVVAAIKKPPSKVTVAPDIKAIAGNETEYRKVLNKVIF